MEPTPLATAISDVLLNGVDNAILKSLPSEGTGAVKHFVRHYYTDAALTFATMIYDQAEAGVMCNVPQRERIAQEPAGTLLHYPLV